MKCVMNKSFQGNTYNSYNTEINNSIDNNTKNEKIYEECPICITDFSNNEKVVKLKCNHKFHYNCIINVKSNSCPICRENIMDIETCDSKHFTHFSNSHLTKNGKCTFCLKGTFSYYIKKKLKENNTINFNNFNK